jgi:hypothetical protein
VQNPSEFLKSRFEITFISEVVQRRTRYHKIEAVCLERDGTHIGHNKTDRGARGTTPAGLSNNARVMVQPKRAAALIAKIEKQLVGPVRFFKQVSF